MISYHHTDTIEEDRPVFIESNLYGFHQTRIKDEEHEILPCT
jgi:hypothetical protein